VTSTSDAAAIAPLVDSFILVAEWGAAPIELVQTVLRGEPGIVAKLAGVVVSKTRLGKLANYVDPRARGAFQYRIG
jgi:hypothetical protein